MRVPDREKFRFFLAERGIETGVHYPKALHQLPALRHLYSGKNFPVAESYSAHGVSLPMGPTMSSPQIDYVCDTVRAYFQKERK